MQTPCPRQRWSEQRHRGEGGHGDAGGLEVAGNAFDLPGEQACLSSGVDQPAGEVSDVQREAGLQVRHVGRTGHADTSFAIARNLLAYAQPQRVIDLVDACWRWSRRNLDDAAGGRTCPDAAGALVAPVPRCRGGGPAVRRRALRPASASGCLDGSASCPWSAARCDPGGPSSAAAASSSPRSARPGAACAPALPDGLVRGAAPLPVLAVRPAAGGLAARPLHLRGVRAAPSLLRPRRRWPASTTPLGLPPGVLRRAALAPPRRCWAPLLPDGFDGGRRVAGLLPGACDRGAGPAPALWAPAGPRCGLATAAGPVSGPRAVPVDVPTRRLTATPPPLGLRCAHRPPPAPGRPPGRLGGRRRPPPDPLGAPAPVFFGGLGGFFGGPPPGLPAPDLPVGLFRCTVRLSAGRRPARRVALVPRRPVPGARGDFLPATGPLPAGPRT